VDTVEAPNPLGGFFQFLLCDSFECGFRIAAPSMVSFVVDNDDVLGGSHVFKDLADVCFVAKRAALVHGLLFGDALFGFPIEFVPVANENFALAEFVFAG